MTAGKSVRRVILPIRLGLDPMQRLLVAGFSSDPEIEGIEPQLFDDPLNGKGMRVLRYRKDGRVDVYWQAGVHVDKSTIFIGSGIGDFAEIAIEPARFEITQHGVGLDVGFTDVQGRQNRLSIRGRAPAQYGFPMLAPVGAGIKTPLRLLLVYMPDIRLLQRAGAIVEARIGDRILRPAAMPILMHGRRVLLIRPAVRPVIATLNPPMDRPVVFDFDAPGCIKADGMSVTADENGAVTRISVGEAPEQAVLSFAPGYPNLPGMPDGASAAGRWSIGITGAPITGGTYGVQRSGQTVATELDVTKDWKPTGLPLSMRLFTLVMRSLFRTWPSTYRWRGTVKLDAAPTMSGAWERKGR